MRAGSLPSGLAATPAPLFLCRTFRPFRRLGGGKRSIKIKVGGEGSPSPPFLTRSVFAADCQGQPRCGGDFFRTRFNVWLFYKHGKNTTVPLTVESKNGNTLYHIKSPLQGDIAHCAISEGGAENCRHGNSLLCLCAGTTARNAGTCAEGTRSGRICKNQREKDLLIAGSDPPCQSFCRMVR